jgi:hypothetical protein
VPYIKAHDRGIVDDLGPANSGELNYAITKLINEYFNMSQRNYQAYNDIIGALEGAKLEIYRRKIIPYENRKIKENGDVYSGLE